MKRLIALLALSTALGLGACNDPNAGEADVADVPVEIPVAAVVEDPGEMAVAPSAVDRPPVDSATLPSERRSSEESVRPESETLFY